MLDLIDRQAAIDMFNVAIQDVGVLDADDVEKVFELLPSAQPEDWMEQNKDRILKAGLEGREIEFRIGGRLFAIREKAQ